MSTLWIEWPKVAMWLWYGQAYVMDNKHRWILLMAFWMHRDTVKRFWGPLYHDNAWPHVARICTHLHLCIQQTLLSKATYSASRLYMFCMYTIPGSWKHPSSCMASILTGHVTHWACLGCSGSAYTTVCSSSCQYPATLHSHWVHAYRPQSTTWSTLCEGDVLHCMRQMVVTPDTDWFSDWFSVVTY